MVLPGDDGAAAVANTPVSAALCANAADEQAETDNDSDTVFMTKVLAGVHDAYA